MMSARTIDIQAVVRSAFEDAATSARAMPLVLLDTVLLAAILGVVRRVFLNEATGLSPLAIGSLEVLINVLVLAPMSIALYRFILMGEIAPRLNAALRSPPLGAFVRASLVVSGLTLVGYFGGAALGAALGPPASTMVVVAAFALTILLSVRLTLLFPAIAVEAPGARWPLAIIDSAGHGWQILFVLALCSIPFLFLGLPLDGLLREIAPLRPAGLILAILGAVLEVAWTAVLVIAAARLYQALGQRLKRPT
jgi:hypothetical protein